MGKSLQPETQVLPGLKVVGSVDLTKFEKKPKQEPVRPKNQKPETGLSFADQLANIYVNKKGQIKSKTYY